ncbi:potassium-transporting ATPase A subunit [Rhodococcus sp. SMB37]|nr:potassium-transporting ATPase A subunit [Rhodococcus sp. SMB37]
MDLTRGTLRILLPLSFVIAMILLSQGVIQSYRIGFAAPGLDGHAMTTALAPVASQEAIKELGTTVAACSPQTRRIRSRTRRR